MKIKRLNENAIVPTQGSDYAAGYDLYSTESVIIPPHDTRMIDTGWAMEIPEEVWGGIFARSGLATKKGLRPANCVGVIDPDYRGPVKVALHNDTDENKVVNIGERIAQFIILPRFIVDWKEVDELNSTVRAEGGFGSTGK